MRHGYFQIRKQIFDHEVKQLLTQIKQLSLFLFVLLGTALPVLFYSALLGFGIILKQQNPIEALLVAWSFLLVQTILLLVLKPAISGSNYALYLYSVARTKARTKARTTFKASYVSYALSLFCQPLLLINLYILASIDVERWFDASHGFVFLLLQIASGLLVLFRTHCAYWFIGLSFCFLMIANSPLLSVCLIDGLNLLDLLSIFCLALLLSLFLPRSFPHIELRFPVFINLWLKHLVAQKGILQFHLSMCLLISVMIAYSTLKMPHYSLYLYAIGAQILILLSASTQLIVNKQIATHILFYQQQFSYFPTKVFQFLMPFSIGIVSLVIYSIFQYLSNDLMFSMGAFLIGYVLILSFCIAVAKIRQKMLMVGWMASCFCLSVFVYCLYNYFEPN